MHIYLNDFLINLWFLTQALQYLFAISVPGLNNYYYLFYDYSPAKLSKLLHYLVQIVLIGRAVPPPLPRVVLVYLNKYNCPHSSAAWVSIVLFLKIYTQELTQAILPRIYKIGHVSPTPATFESDWVYPATEGEIGPGWQLQLQHKQGPGWDKVFHYVGRS